MLSDESLREVVKAWEESGKSIQGGAALLKLNYHNFHSKLKTAKRKGLHLDPAIRSGMGVIGMNTAPPGGWIKSNKPDESGLTYSFRFKTGDAESDRKEQIEQIRASLEGMTPAKNCEKPQHCVSDLLTVYPIADVHIGMQAWGEETGEDYDTKIATDRLESWMGRAIASSPNSETAIILDVGDLTHADDQTNQTQKSKHILDVDTRHFNTLDLTIRAMATSIELAKAKHLKVIVRILPGNHNPTTYMGILFALCERYREDERVQIQKVPGEFFVYQFGKCMIAAHHGDKAKASNLVLYLADQFAGIWGKTQHRYLWTGHLHHHKSEDIGGVTWEQLRAVTARDAWATSHAYTARSQLQAITYQRDLGEVQRVKIAGP